MQKCALPKEKQEKRGKDQKFNNNRHMNVKKIAAESWINDKTKPTFE